MSFHLSISGFAGSGKTTIIDTIKTKYPKQISVFEESARDIYEQGNYLNGFKDEDRRMFQKSIIGTEFSKLKHALANKGEFSLFDRNILDNLAFTAMLFGKEEIDLDGVQKSIDIIREKYKVDYLYDLNILIETPNNIEFIKNNILKDEMRQKTISPSHLEFIEKSKKWEGLYLELNNDLDGINKELSVIKHFSDDEDQYEKHIYDRIYEKMDTLFFKDKFIESSLQELIKKIENNTEMNIIISELNEIINKISRK